MVDPPSLIFPNMEATIDGKDGEDYSAAGIIKMIRSVSKIYIRNASGIAEATGMVRLQNGVRQIAAWSVCALGQKDKSTPEFPEMEATVDGKDGEDITQAQAETQSTYPWDFIDIWYMGKYPKLR